MPDAWINTDVCDAKDGEIGKVGYEINFNRYFYQYEPPRPLDEINTDIQQLWSKRSWRYAARGGRVSGVLMKDSGVEWLGEIPRTLGCQKRFKYVARLSIWRLVEQPKTA